MNRRTDPAERPALGILTMADHERSFRGNRNNFRDICLTGEQMGIDVYVLTHQDYRPGRRRVLAYAYDSESKEWKTKVVPTPNVIYNRIPFREDERLDEVSELLKACLRHPGTHLFNPGFFNKWTLMNWLKKSRLTRRYVPETKRLGAKTDLARMLEQHRLLYLKPESGKAGHGIMQIRQRSLKRRRTFELRVQENKNSETVEYRTLRKLKDALENAIENEGYIVQQGIRLARYRNRPFDLRLLIQKNKSGRWTLTGIGARLAGSESITTHVPRGGSIEEPRKLLRHAFGVKKGRMIIRRTGRAAARIAKQIELASGHNHGEMSMDLGVDTKGNIWFFEANAKPMKFDEADIRQLSLQRLLEYTIYLHKRRDKKRR